MNILVTGCAGFIGFHLCNELILDKKKNIYGIDNLNKYYDVNLKKQRLNLLKKNKNFNFYKIDIKEYDKLKKLFSKLKFKYVINLAAQAGVRYSITNPRDYLNSNLIGFFNILDLSKDFKVSSFIYASSSSVYGDNNKFPLKEEYNTDRPLSFYAASKKSNEILAHSYSNIYNLQTIGLRFFTVYGPYGRPDMALFKFINNINQNKKIQLFNNGNHLRDFTYIDDAVNYIKKIIFFKSNKKIPFEIFNIGNSNPIQLKKFLYEIETNLNKKAKVLNKELQKGDVIKTHANINKIIKITKIRPKTNYKLGIKKFVKWFLNKNNNE